MADFIQKYLPLIMIISGTVNILCIKWADNMQSKGSDKVLRHFQHPFFQALVMFFGEFLCFLIFKLLFCYLKRKADGSEETNYLTKGNQDFRPTIFLIPAICDVIATTMLLVGLYLTYASSFQMLRGTVIIFAGLFSVSILNENLKFQHWIGMLVLIISASLIAVADYFTHASSQDGNNILFDSKAVITGDLFIISSQVFQAFQLVYEEKYIKILDVPPLQAIGWEGIFGSIILAVMLIPMNFIHISDPPFNNNARSVIEDLPDAVIQLFNNYLLLIVHGIFVISVAIYNYSAISITKETTATNRIIIDTMRIIFVWFVCSALGWQTFHYLQLFGYIMLMVGIFLYRNVVFVPIYRWIIGIYLRRRYGGLPSEEIISQQADTI